MITDSSKHNIILVIIFFSLLGICAIEKMLFGTTMIIYTFGFLAMFGIATLAEVIIWERYWKK